ncbi:low density lipoprotein receptor adapter protein 1 isoform X2 [Chamaea fasciata]|uniref:low density lipoprotein receptor adapter protein 1 isoform X2 n=1 Tax=Chamaea fasciata TaxID=190680 RepID=UPI00336AAB82
MDALKSAGRALLRSPSVHRPSWAGGRHKKLPENWTDTRETLLEGMLFSLKYLGMTLVEQPKGEELSAAAVKRIVATAKASGKKLQKVTLKVSPRGIVLRDSRSNELIENISIYRISYCTADKSHDKVFAYIAQNQLNENLECHAFLCSKRKMAQAVTLTVAQAFKIAFEFWQAAKEEKEKRERSILEAEGTSSEAPAHPVTPAMGNLLDLEDPTSSPLGSSSSPSESPELGRSSFGPSPSVNNNVVWVRQGQESSPGSSGPTWGLWGLLSCPGLGAMDFQCLLPREGSVNGVGQSCCRGVECPCCWSSFSQGFVTRSRGCSAQGQNSLPGCLLFAAHRS